MKNTVQSHCYITPPPHICLIRLIKKCSGSVLMLYNHVFLLFQLQLYILGSPSQLYFSASMDESNVNQEKNTVLNENRKIAMAEKLCNMCIGMSETLFNKNSAVQCTPQTISNYENNDATKLQFLIYFCSHTDKKKKLPV